MQIVQRGAYVERGEENYATPLYRLGSGYIAATKFSTSVFVKVAKWESSWAQVEEEVG